MIRPPELWGDGKQVKKRKGGVKRAPMDESPAKKMRGEDEQQQGIQGEYQHLLMADGFAQV